MPRIAIRMSVTEFVARLLVQVPPKRQKLVNYYGLYSNKVRGMYQKRTFDIHEWLRKRRKRERSMSWRSQLWRIFEVDPLKCPHCSEELSAIDLVTMPESSLLAQPP